MARPAQPMFAPPSDGDLGALSFEHAAEFLDVSLSVVWQLVNRGELVPARFGRKPVLLKRDLSALLERKRDEERQSRGIV